ncbi:MAG TPA: hypothetical protein VI522_00755, partial [Gammaproteobacteria bacterium]|nr:hypothetical protein [Gammaproteobacteria bacterium]
INEAVKLPLPNGYLQWFPETSACVSAVLAAAPADCVAKPLFHMYPAASNDRDNRSAFFPSTQGEDAQEPVNNVVPDYDLQVFKKVSNT